MLGFDNFAAYMMDKVMAKTPEAAENLLYQVWKPAVNKVKQEVAEMKELAGFDIQPWDYYYYIEKLKAHKFNLSENDVRPYFKLENVVKNGLFYIANRLYGITFTELPDAPKYNPEVTVYEVKDKDGKDTDFDSGHNAKGRYVSDGEKLIGDTERVSDAVCNQ